PRTAWAWPGHVSPATTTVDAGADRPIRASCWVKSGVDGPDSVHSVEGGDELGTLPSGIGTRSLMWRSTTGLFDGTGGCSGQRHITNLATLTRLCGRPHNRVATVTDLLEQNVPLEDVQHLAGHADPRTTRLYDRRRRKVTR